MKLFALVGTNIHVAVKRCEECPLWSSDEWGAWCNVAEFRGNEFYVPFNEIHKGCPLPEYTDGILILKERP